MLLLQLCHAVTITLTCYYYNSDMLLLQLVHAITTPLTCYYYNYYMLLLLRAVTMIIVYTILLKLLRAIIVISAWIATNITCHYHNYYMLYCDYYMLLFRLLHTKLPQLLHVIATIITFSYCCYYT